MVIRYRYRYRARYRLFLVPGTSSNNWCQAPKNEAGAWHQEKTVTGTVTVTSKSEELKIIYIGKRLSGYEINNSPAS